MYESSYSATPSPAFGGVTVLDFDHANWCIGVSPCFNLHFPDNIQCGESLHGLIYHLYISFDEVCSGVWSFLNQIV